MMYASPNRVTSHRLVALDVPTPSWMRAPGECPGMYALESAMDELALACGIDPIELRIRNEPREDPESGNPFSSRNLVACLRTGAERFGWADRAPQPAARRHGAVADGDGRRGVDLSRAAPPVRGERATRAGRQLRRRGRGRRHRHRRAHRADADRRRCARRSRPSACASSSATRGCPTGPVAGGSMGTGSWGSAVVKACRELVEGNGAEAHADTTDDVEADEEYARHGFGAQFVEVRVNAVTGEIRVPRALGVFATGHIVNPKTARSQLIGGMTMGLGMALLEETIIDARFGDFLNRDLAGYHVPTYADIGEIEVDLDRRGRPAPEPDGHEGHRRDRHRRHGRGRRECRPPRDRTSLPAPARSGSTTCCRRSREVSGGGRRTGGRSREARSGSSRACAPVSAAARSRRASRLAGFSGGYARGSHLVRRLDSCARPRRSAERHTTAGASNKERRCHEDCQGRALGRPD